MKQVVLLIIPNLGGGGAQRVFRQHVRHYSSRFETVICSFNMNDAVDEDREFSIVSLNIPAGRNLFEKSVNFVRRVIAVRSIKARYGVTLSVSHLEGADYVNVLSGRGERKILWIHGSKEYDRNISGWIGWIRKRWLLPLLYARADAIACVSKALTKELTDIYHLPESKIWTIYNGIDKEQIAIESKQTVDSLLKTALVDKFVIVTHCRLATQKNLHSLLRLASSMKAISNLRWLIIGDGPQRAELLAQCSSLNLAVYSPWTRSVPDPDVYFLGYLANPYPYLRLCDLYIMTSLWEGFPLSICEAMACELPVMAADCPTGPAEILLPDADSKRACGFLMPILHVTDENTLALWRKTLENVMRDNSLIDLYRERASVRVREFSASVMQENIDLITRAALA